MSSLLSVQYNCLFLIFIFLKPASLLGEVLGDIFDVVIITVLELDHLVGWTCCRTLESAEGWLVLQVKGGQLLIWISRSRRRLLPLKSQLVQLRRHIHHWSNGKRVDWLHCLIILHDTAVFVIVQTSSSFLLGRLLRSQVSMRLLLLAVLI